MDRGAWRATVHGVTNRVDRGNKRVQSVGSQGVRTGLRGEAHGPSLALLTFSQVVS